MRNHRKRCLRNPSGTKRPRQRLLRVGSAALQSAFLVCDYHVDFRWMAGACADPLPRRFIRRSVSVEASAHQRWGDASANCRAGTRPRPEPALVISIKRFAGYPRRHAARSAFASSSPMPLCEPRHSGAVGPDATGPPITLPVALTLCQTARNVAPQSASKTDPALREALGSLGPVMAEICGAGSGSTPTDLRVLLPSWSGVIR